MEIVAQRGTDTYLVDVGNGKASVVNMKMKHVFPPRNLQAILARGYWKPFPGGEEISNKVLALFPSANKHHIVHIVRRSKDGTIH